MVLQVQVYLSYEVVRPLILIKMVSFLFKLRIFYILGHKNWLIRPFLCKRNGYFLGFASPDRFIVWSRQTAHSNQKKARKADLANSRDRKCRICKSWWENRPFWLELVVWRPHTVNLSGLAKPKISAFSAKNGWFS